MVEEGIMVLINNKANQSTQSISISYVKIQILDRESKKFKEVFQVAFEPTLDQSVSRIHRICQMWFQEQGVIAGAVSWTANFFGVRSSTHQEKGEGSF